MQTSYVQIILETKIYSLFVLYIRKNDVAKCISLQSTHPWRNILEKKAVVSIAKIIVYNPKDLHKLYSELYFNAEIVRTIYILETKRNSLFVLYIRKNDVANCFSQQNTHPWRTILEKKAVVSIAKIIVYNS